MLSHQLEKKHFEHHEQCNRLMNPTCHNTFNTIYVALDCAYDGVVTYGGSFCDGALLCHTAEEMPATS